MEEYEETESKGGIVAQEEVVQADTNGVETDAVIKKRKRKEKSCALTKEEKKERRSRRSKKAGFIVRSILFILITSIGVAILVKGDAIFGVVGKYLAGRPLREEELVATKVLSWAMFISAASYFLYLSRCTTVSKKAAIQKGLCALFVVLYFIVAGLSLAFSFYHIKHLNEIFGEDKSAWIMWALYIFCAILFPIYILVVDRKWWDALIMVIMPLVAFILIAKFIWWVFCCLRPTGRERRSYKAVDGSGNSTTVYTYDGKEFTDDNGNRYTSTDGGKTIEKY